jgi:hypothetical protein
MSRLNIWVILDIWYAHLTHNLSLSVFFSLFHFNEVGYVGPTFTSNYYMGRFCVKVHNYKAGKYVNFWWLEKKLNWTWFATRKFYKSIFKLQAFNFFTNHWLFISNFRRQSFMGEWTLIQISPVYCNIKPNLHKRKH